MTKYLFEANYVGEGIKGLMREGGSKRRDVVVDALKSVGGSLESFYFAFGDADAFVIGWMSSGRSCPSNAPPSSMARLAACA